MAAPYKFKLHLDDGLVDWDLPRTPVLPDGSEKYAIAPWKPHYTWFKLAWMIYGDFNKVYLLLAANNLTDPYEPIDEFRFLRHEYLSEVVQK